MIVNNSINANVTVGTSTTIGAGQSDGGNCTMAAAHSTSAASATPTSAPPTGHHEHRARLFITVNGTAGINGLIGGWATFGQDFAAIGTTGANSLLSVPGTNGVPAYATLAAAGLTGSQPTPNTSNASLTMTGGIPPTP